MCYYWCCILFYAYIKIELLMYPIPTLKKHDENMTVNQQP